MTSLPKILVLNAEIKEIISSATASWDNWKMIQELNEALRSKYISSKESVIRKYKKGR